MMELEVGADGLREGRREGGREAKRRERWVGSGKEKLQDSSDRVGGGSSVYEILHVKRVTRLYEKAF